MSENKGGLISREALMRGRVCNDPVRIAAMCEPAVDAVEVVRCKDCKHHSIEETECGAKYIACNRFDEVMEADDFCSYGERKGGVDCGENDPG